MASTTGNRFLIAGLPADDRGVDRSNDPETEAPAALYHLGGVHF